MSSNDAFTKIMDGLNDAIAIVRGEAGPSTYVVHDPEAKTGFFAPGNDESAATPKDDGA